MAFNVPEDSLSLYWLTVQSCTVGQVFRKGAVRPKGKLNHVRGMGVEITEVVVLYSTVASWQTCTRVQAQTVLEDLEVGCPIW